MQLKQCFVLLAISRRFTALATMKIESLLVQYLYSRKSLTLQGIGTFTLHGEIPQPTDTESQAALPEGSVTFQEDKHAGQDEGLIQFIVEHTRKILPLATSDLESFSILTKEYLNIGKPFTLEGVGTLLKNQQGVYEFTQGGFVHPKLDNGQMELREKEAGAISFSTPPRKTGKSKNIWIGSLILLILLIVPAIIYYYYRQQPAPVVSTENMIQKPVRDTLPEDTIPAIVLPVETDTVRYLVIKTYSDSTRALREVKRLTSYNHKVRHLPIDSATHYVIMPILKSVPDTSKVKDSINLLFGVRSYFMP